MQKNGRMCVTNHQENSHHAKLVNHGTSSIWVGYTDGNSPIKWQVFNPKTEKIILTNDMTFLQNSYRYYN